MEGARMKPEQANPKPWYRLLLGTLKNTGANDATSGRKLHKKESVNVTGNEPSNSGQGTRKGKGKIVDHDPVNWKEEGLNQPSPPPDSLDSLKELGEREKEATGHRNSASSKNAGEDNSEAITGSQNSTSTPPTMEDIDRWNYHTSLQQFGKKLQNAANAVFPNEKEPRYKEVDVLMLNWEDEDPNLPVSIEIDKLADIFSVLYHFKVTRWSIPDENCHFKLAERVMRFVEPHEYSKTHLKIVYYAGHAKLMDTRALALTSWRNKSKSKCPMVKWGAIQSFIEESPSDALILLDCCASGTANTSEGNGVTEVISACAWNQIANGVGPFSLTNALGIELERLSYRGSFSTGELYRNVYLRTQSLMPEGIAADGRNVERHPAPIHLVLTQDPKRPRSIQISVQSFSRWTPPTPAYHASSFGSEASKNSFARSEELIRGQSKRPAQFPRLAFAIRLNESFQTSGDMEDVLLEWLRDLPIIAEEVKIEAGFDSFSTLLILSLPFSLSAYIPFDPAVVPLGPIRSENRLIVYPITLDETSETLRERMIEVESALYERMAKRLQLIRIPKLASYKLFDSDPALKEGRQTGPQWSPSTGMSYTTKAKSLPGKKISAT